ncbi:hypothetical protein FB446DRAFT_791044 [Lentinula raphanica]|nr:hypothetical protein FB446DRAFT_791044 [Lentinula raphanica]
MRVMCQDLDLQSQQSSSSQGSSVLSDATDHDFENKKFDKAFVQLMQELQVTQVPFPRLSEEELAQWFQQLKLTTASNPDTRGDEMVWNEIEGEWQLPAHSYEVTIAEDSSQDQANTSQLDWEGNELTLISETPSINPKVDVSENKEMCVDLMLDEDLPAPSQKPIICYFSPMDLTVEEPLEQGDLEISGAGTSEDPYEFYQ